LCYKNYRNANEQPVVWASPSNRILSRPIGTAGLGRTRPARGSPARGRAQLASGARGPGHGGRGAGRAGLAASGTGCAGPGDGHGADEDAGEAAAMDPDGKKPRREGKGYRLGKVEPNGKGRKGKG